MIDIGDTKTWEIYLFNNVFMIVPIDRLLPINYDQWTGDKLFAGT